jgi:hypothetical protein
LWCANDVHIAIHLEIKLRGAARAPKEMCVRHTEMSKDEFAAGKPLVSRSEILLQRIFASVRVESSEPGASQNFVGLKMRVRCGWMPPLNQAIIEMASSSSIGLDGSNSAAG